ncbi:MAG: MogA/MoaB family molybdenum cofactor biosynthesis protein [Acidobacteria bacterium]|nr:MAG: MogA/MoaB family molybdenum cofactor biosynthesis protein [Acidobacteriota bacterium]
MTGSAEEHRRAARRQVADCAVLTISDSRTPETDGGGDLIEAALTAAGHRVVERRLVKDEPRRIEALLRRWIDGGTVQLVVTTGGTGLSRRDATYEVVAGLLDKTLDGFGELFRMLSYQQVGAAAMLSRAVAGLAGETLIFTLPGSPNAVRLALDKLIVPELSHLLWERRR